MPAWDSLTDDERHLYGRMMETFAGFLTHTDAQVQRVLDFIDELGEGDDTIVIVMSDNGASAEGGAKGSFNEQYFFNFVPESTEENLARIDDLGTPRANNHYPWGWAWAGNTPLKRFKRDTHEGGVADPLIVHWPARLGDGGTRHQYVHAIDVTPTLLDLIGIEPPAVIGGIEQSPIEGVSFASTFADAGAPAPHVTQYYEMLGSRALYHDGWKSVVFHPTPFIAYDGTDVSKPFDEDIWELYRVADDFSEVDDLAEKEPEQLERMKELWWEEAAKYQVLPAQQRAGEVRRPPLAARALRVLPGHRAAAGGHRPEPAQPGLHPDRRPHRARRRTGRRRDRGAGQPLGRLRGLPQGPAPALRLQLRRHRHHGRRRRGGAARRRGGGEGRAHPRRDRHLRRGALLRRRARRAGQDRAPHAGHLRDDRLRGRLPAGRRRSAPTSRAAPRSPRACSARS